MLPRTASIAVLAACVSATGCDNAAPDDDLAAVGPAPVTRVATANAALAKAHIPTVDPASMHEAEIGKVLGNGARCEFRYMASGAPVLAVSGLSSAGRVARIDGVGAAANEAAMGVAGVVKINGSLVRLTAEQSAGDAQPSPAAFALGADPIRISVRADSAEGREPDERHEATMLFEIGTDLRVGYRGFLRCDSRARP
jgi:hypothetical protein